jgi:hypothetical protein
MIFARAAPSIVGDNDAGAEDGFLCRLVNEIDGGLDALRQIRRAPHPVHVHVEDARLLPEEVMVESRHVQPVLQQGRHDGIHLVLGEHEVAHHHVHALALR